MKTLREQAAELLDRCGTVTLASVDKEGHPRPVPMSKIKNEGLATVWMATGMDGHKTAHFQANPKAGLCFQDADDMTVMTGSVEVVTDPAHKHTLWQDWFIGHFPGGPDDPNYCLLKFTGGEATYWIKGVFVSEKL